MKKIFLTILLLAGFVNHAQIKKPLPDDGDMAIPQPQEPYDENKIYNAVQVPPQFPEGYEAFRSQLAAKVDISKFEMAEGTTLKVFVKFVVERDGSLTNIQIIRDPGYGAGKEVERALNSLKEKWTPAMLEGKPVRCYFSVPIVIVVPQQKNQPGINDIPMPVETTPTTENDTAAEIPDNSIYNSNSLQVQPEFPGGKEALANFINSNVKKENLEAVTTEKEINVFIQFIVEKDGTATNHKIVEAPNTGIVKEVLRVLTSLKTRWKPGINNGRPVRSLYSTQVIMKVPQQ